MRHLLFTSLVITCVLHAITASAQLSDSLKTEIRKVSDQMFHNGNQFYLELDAICDGYLPLGTKYKLTGDQDALYVNSTRLPLSYVAKHKAFMAENFRITAGKVWANSDGVKLEEILDAKNPLGQFPNFCCTVGSGYEGRAKKIDSKKVITHLISMMVADRIVDTSQYFNLHFDNTPSLTVNDQKIDSRYAQKYAVALKADGFDIIEDIGNIRYNNNYKKQPW